MATAEQITNSPPDAAVRDQWRERDGRRPEVSIVMPCLNEAETLARCIREAQAAIQAAGVSGEVVIADNGSSDGSQRIASELGARVVHVPRKGYGSALMGGIEAAEGLYVLMGDADASYDFGHLPRFLESLREGADLVMGNRFLGGIEPGAMPRLHRYLGNPVLTRIGRLFFRSPSGDFHCGLRALRKSAYNRLQLRTPGMEFASEMVIKATLKGLRIDEVPTVLRPDGRSRSPHLRSWRDGWRHLRFMLLFSPRWLFLWPGMILFLVGLLSTIALAITPISLDGIGLDVHTMLVAAMTALVGYQLVLAGVFARAFAGAVGLYPPSRFLQRFARRLSLEYGVLAGIGLMIMGTGLLAYTTAEWGWQGFRSLDPHLTMRLIIPAMLISLLGVQTAFGSFFLSLLTLLPDQES
jgi:glycosyltransferase involved in cell wall biosynthesis